MDTWFQVCLIWAHFQKAPKWRLLVLFRRIEFFSPIYVHLVSWFTGETDAGVWLRYRGVLLNSYFLSGSCLGPFFQNTLSSKKKVIHLLKDSKTAIPKGQWDFGFVSLWLPGWKKIKKSELGIESKYLDNFIYDNQLSFCISLRLSKLQSAQTGWHASSLTTNAIVF